MRIGLQENIEKDGRTLYGSYEYRTGGDKLGIEKYSGAF
jgi:hypothetical protein